MSTNLVEDRRQAMDETAVRVVRALISWHGLAMPDVAAAIGQSIGTVERRLSRNPKVRTSWQGWELQLLADYFGVPVSAFYTGEVDLAASRLTLGDYRSTTSQYLADIAGVPAARAAYHASVLAA